MHRSGGVGVAPDPVHGIPALTRLAWCTGTPLPGVYTDLPNTCLSNGVDTWCIRQSPPLVCVAPGPLQLVIAWAGGYEDNSIKPGLPANTGSYQATVWKQAANPNTGGTGIDVLFGGSAVLPDIAPAEIVLSDNGPTLAVGDIVWLRELTVVPAGGKWPLGVKTVAQTDGTAGGRQGTGTPPDLLHGGTINPTTTTNSFGACSSIAVGATGLPVVALYGTSKAEGSNALNHEHSVVQACNAAGIPIVRLGAGGESALTLSKSQSNRIRYALGAQATVIVNEHGVNDGGSFKPADGVGLARRLRTLHSQLAAIDGGRPVIQLTLSPSYTGYNATVKSYADPALMTPSDWNAARTWFNDWVRGGCPEIAGTPVVPGTSGATPSPYVRPYDPGDDMADADEPSRNAGIWRGDGTTTNRYTADGTHESQVAAAAEAAVINTNRFWTLSGLTPPSTPPPPDEPPPPPPSSAILNLQKLGGSLVRL